MSIDNGAISLVFSSSSSFASSINYFLSSLSSKPNPFISFHFRFLLDLKSCSTYKVISFGILRKTPFLLLFYPFIQWFGIRILFPFFLFSFSFFIQELPNSQISIFDPRKPKICTIFGVQTFQERASLRLLLFHPSFLFPFFPICVRQKTIVRGSIVSPVEIVRCRYVGETETKGRNYTSRYFSRCNQSDYVSRGRLTVTFAALENVETRTDCSYAHA